MNWLWFIVGMIVGAWSMRRLMLMVLTEVEVCFYPNSDKQQVIAYGRAAKRAVNAGDSPIVEIPVGRKQTHFFSLAGSEYDEAQAMAAYAKIERLMEDGKNFRVAYSQEQLWPPKP